MPDRASSEGRAIRQVELLSNKLLTTAFEASLGCVAVMRRAKRRQRGSRDSYRAPKYQQTRASTLWSEGKTICGFIVKVRFHTALRCRKELFMLYKDCTSTGEKSIQCLSPAKKYKVYKSSINKSLHFAQRRLSSSTRG